LLKEAQERDCKEPMILLTGQGNLLIDCEALNSGAVDYLVKSQLTSEKLDRCIRYSLERSSVLKESRASEQKFRSIFERSKDVIFIADDKLVFQNVNDASLDLLGYHPEEILHLNHCQLFASRSQRDQIRRQIVKNKEIIDYNIEFRTKDGAKKSCVMSASLEYDKTGMVYIQGIIHDVSMSKKIEEIKLQSEKLEAKGIAIRTLAHEIRNPLQNIILSMGNLKHETTEENQEFLNVIERNTKRINDLVNELLDSNQYYKMKLEVTPLQVVVDNAIEKAIDSIQLKKIKLNFNKAANPALALLDREKIQIAFLNIILNSIDAMKEETGELTISVISQSNCHKVLIKDNGCGITKDNSLRLFDPYFTTKPNGTGLGLAATYAILQSHRAGIEVASLVNKGTTFTVTFPAL
jgi:PAS domain S-box-containing protein